MNDLGHLLSPLAGSATAIALHALRLLPAAVMSPFLGGPVAPPLVRLGLALVLGACAWSAAGAIPFDRSGPGLPILLVRELTLGAGLGFAASVPFEAARAAGRLVDTLRGSTLSELHVAPLRQRESATGDLLAQWAIVLAASVGGDRLVVAALLDTFRAAPVGTAANGAALLGIGLRGATELMACAVAVGAPTAAGVLAADLALAVASRAAPQLQLTSSAQPARAAVGLLAIAVPAALLAGRLTATLALSTGVLRDLGRLGTR